MVTHCLLSAALYTEISSHNHPPSFHPYPHSALSSPSHKRTCCRIASIKSAPIHINWCSTKKTGTFSNARNHSSPSWSVHSSPTTSLSVPEAFGVTESGRFSITDQDLLSRGFEVHRSAGSLNLDELNTLFVKVGFPSRQKSKLRRALKYTSSLLWIQDTNSQKLVAFARATGDDIFNAVVWDVVVDPSFQGLGLGKVVMERLLVDLVAKGLSNICLYAEPNVVGFYRSLGFISDPDNIRAMAYFKKRR